MPIADISFGELLLLVFALFALGSWFWVVFIVMADLLGDHERSGWWKALWLPFLIFIPFITALLYVIIHGSDLTGQPGGRHIGTERGRAAHEREAAPRSPATELAQLRELREQGSLSDVEFEAAKARVLA